MEEVHVDNERDVFTLRSEAERGPRAIEGGAHTCTHIMQSWKIQSWELKN